jgi:syntaxin-binding protein 1
VLVIDESSKKIIDNVVKEDDILNENIASKWNMKAKNDCMLSADKISRESRRRGK